MSRGYFSYICILTDTGDRIFETQKIEAELYRKLNLVYRDRKDSTNSLEFFFCIDGYNFFCQREYGYYFLIITSDNIRARIPCELIRFISKDFSNRFCFKREKFNKKKYLQFVNDNIKYYLEEKEGDKLNELFSQVDEIASLMNENINKAISNGRKLESSTKTTEILIDNIEETYEEDVSTRKYCTCCII